MRSLSPNRDEPRGAPQRAEVEAAVFHVVEAARQDLPEALLALARLASPEEDHRDFFPQVRGSESLANTQLALLAAAAAQGSKEAMASLAALVLRKEDSASSEELRMAAKHLEAFAAESLELLKEKAKKAQEASIPGSSHLEVHGTFGWDAHGFTGAAAARRAAAIFEKLPDSAGSPARLQKLAEDADRKGRA
eukprot:s6745_g1.t1